MRGPHFHSTLDPTNYVAGPAFGAEACPGLDQVSCLLNCLPWVPASWHAKSQSFQAAFGIRGLALPGKPEEHSSPVGEGGRTIQAYATVQRASKTKLLGQPNPV